ncbi:MAG: alpha-glucosidase [Desulfitobacterium hafniense]|nr:alpha-glucosidase [Desulfitobacterium hafniense]
MEFIPVENGFKLLVAGQEIICHNEKTPWIYAGKGQASFDMHHGNFKIKEEVQEKIALTDFSIEEESSPDIKGTLVTFSRKGLYSVTVLFTVEEGRAVIKFVSNQDGINRLWLRLQADKEERIYGCGEQFSYFDLRGRNFPLWVAEQGVGRNKQTLATFMADTQAKAGGDYYSTYFPQPTFISSKKYYCHVEDTAYMDFDFSHESYHELQIWNVPKNIVIEAADTYIDLVGKLTNLLGRQPELPDWIYDGVWIGMQGGTETVLSKLEHALSKGLKVSGIWAQDWEGKRITSFGKRLMWNWVWNKELYPGLDEEIKKLKARGIRFLGYINPYLAIEGHLYIEASEKGYIVKNQEGKDYLIDCGEFYSGIVDLTNPTAFEWYKKVIKVNMIEFGLAGWMADFGEYLPTDAVLYNGISAELMHNAWPALWARVNREAVEESGKLNEVTFFMRSGYTGSQKYSTMTWAGDQNVDWSLDDGLASVIPAALSLGMTGFGLHSSDIGGYTTLYDIKRTKELFMRWAEFGAFTPLMRTHEGNRPDDNWQFDSDDETLAHFAKMSRVYTTLSPYIKAAVKENSSHGVPVMRPLFMHYESSKAYELKYEYLFGRDLLVAPVIEPEKTEWTVYLPEDEWIHLWTGKEYGAGEANIDAPLGYPPVFYRKSSAYAELFKEVAKV